MSSGSCITLQAAAREAVGPRRSAASGAPPAEEQQADVVRRSVMHSQSEARSGLRRNQVTASGRQLEGRFTARCSSRSLSIVVARPDAHAQETRHGQPAML